MEKLLPRGEEDDVHNYKHTFDPFELILDLGCLGHVCQEPIRVEREPSQTSGTFTMIISFPKGSFPLSFKVYVLSLQH